MINKKELKEEKAPPDLYQFCLLRQSLWFINSSTKKKENLNKAHIACEGKKKKNSLSKLYTLNFFTI